MESSEKGISGSDDIMDKDDTIYGIRKGYIQIAILLVIMIFMLGWLVGKADAVNQSYYIPTTPPTPTPEPVTIEPTPIPTPFGINTPLPTPTPIPKTIRRLTEQGECVELGETVDFAGIGWYTGYIAYYNQYRTLTTEGLNASKIYEIQPYEIKHYYIDPIKFKNFPGNWYSHYEHVEGGNSMLFKVAVDKCIKKNETNLVPLVVDNKTITLVAENFTLTAKTLPGIDYIVSRNLPTSIETEYDSRYWMFGTNPNDNLYDIPVDNDGMIVFTKDFSNKLVVGNYRIIDVYPGENFIIEETYDKSTSTIASPFRDVLPVTIRTMTSENVMAALKYQVRKSIDDTFTEINITVEDPYIEVKRLDNLANADGTNSVMLSGYTNANVGDEITLEFDKGHIDSKLIRENTWTTNVVDGGGSNTYRTWYKTAIFNANDFVAGQHTMTITTSSGASVGAPVFIRKELAANYNPPDYIQFIDNSPYIPVPTVPPAPPPVTVTVVQTVIKEKVVEKEKIVMVDPYPYVMGGIAALIVILYALYTISRAYMNARRTRNEKKE